MAGMMRVDAGVASLEGDLTLANATQWLAEGEAAMSQGALAFDLAGVAHLDSSALSLLFSLRRRADAVGKTLEFRIMLVRTYASSLASVADYKIEFKPFRAAPGDTDVTVGTEVSKPGAPPIPIDYRLEKQGNGWKVFDVIVDNVSLVTVYRNSFNSEVRKGGVDGLIAALVRRNQKP